MEVKPAGFIPYSEKTWNDFKERLVTRLLEKAIDCDEAFENTDVKNFISSYVEKELLNEKKDNERLLLNINIRLSNMEIHSSYGKKIFPIINEYVGHHLFKTYYFYRDSDNSIKMGCEEIVKKQIIL